MKYVLVLLILAHASLQSCAQRPFQKQIDEYKRMDEQSPPPKHGIVFVGSSSIRLWRNLEKDFEGYPVINRGFGGSGLDHAIMYADDIIIPYEPKQIVIYSGENDVAGGKVKPADMIHRFKRLFKKIRTALPNTHIVYISMKPSPSREQFRPVMEESNKLIRDFLANEPQTAYVDVWPLMLDASGKPRKELFTSDDLHMNTKGYEIWRKAVGEVLLR
jgi:lysophospholipase L1-like esterase